LQELSKPFYEINSQGSDNIFGITSNPNMNTEGEFGGITQELGKHDGQISPNLGGNQTPFLASKVTHLCTPKGNLGALLRNWANMMAKHPQMQAKIRFL
jgi:hypothetical protein